MGNPPLAGLITGRFSKEFIGQADGLLGLPVPDCCRINRTRFGIFVLVAGAVQAARDTMMMVMIQNPAIIASSPFFSCTNQLPLSL
jgi:hypothetical protein